MIDARIDDVRVIPCRHWISNKNIYDLQRFHHHEIATNAETKYLYYVLYINLKQLAHTCKIDVKRERNKTKLKWTNQELK